MHGTVWKEKGERRIVIIISLSQKYKSKFVLITYKGWGVILSPVDLKIELISPLWLNDFLVRWPPMLGMLNSTINRLLVCSDLSLSGLLIAFMVLRKLSHNPVLICCVIIVCNDSLHALNITSSLPCWQVLGTMSLLTAANSYISPPVETPFSHEKHTGVFLIS